MSRENISAEKVLILECTREVLDYLKNNPNTKNSEFRMFLLEMLRKKSGQSVFRKNKVGKLEVEVLTEVRKRLSKAKTESDGWDSKPELTDDEAKIAKEATEKIDNLFQKSNAENYVEEAIKSVDQSAKENNVDISENKKALISLGAMLAWAQSHETEGEKMKVIPYFSKSPLQKVSELEHRLENAEKNIEKLQSFLVLILNIIESEPKIKIILFERLAGIDFSLVDMGNILGEVTKILKNLILKK